MSITAPWLIHIGPLRSESKAIIESEMLPTFILNPSKGEQEERNALRQVQDAQQPKYEHINTIIAPRAGEATRYHYNLPGFESLAPATGLKALYPGLSETRSQPVETQTLISVLSDHGEPTITHLVLEQPEQAIELLTAWQSEGLLEQLKMLYVRTSPESLYDGMPTQAELTAWCERHGFEINETNAEDPELPLLGFKRNALHVPLEDAREEAKALKAKLIEYEVLLKENAQQLSRAASALRATDAERNELKEECDTLKQQRDEQAKATEAAKTETAKLKQARDALTQERDTLKQQCADHAKATEAAKAETAKLNQARDALTQERDTLKQQRDEQAKATEAAKAEATKLKQARDALIQEHDTLKQQRDEQAKAIETGKAEAATLKQARDALTQERDQAQKALTQVQEKLEQTHTWFMNRKQQVEEGAEKLKMLAAERDALKAENDERAQQLGKLAKELEEAHVIAKSEATKQSQALEEANKQIEALSQQLASKENSLHKTEERFSSLESKLDQLFGEQRSYIQQTTNALGQHVTRSAQQQRDEQALTHYLQQGQRPVSTTLAPGYAMALLEQRATQRYDVVMVLGSPDTTELLAQAVMNEQGNQQRLTHASQLQSNDTQAVVAPSHDDLPQSIVSIEHQKAQCEALKKRLDARQCRQAVNVVHAPWVESHYQGQTPLFYACEATLQRLNQWLREDAKVLVVVGPALAHAGHSRLAALPQLLQHLPTQRLDIVIESTDGSHEQGLANEWEALLNARQRDVQWLNIPAALSLRVEG